MFHRVLLSPPRHPLARMLAGVVGALALLALIAFGVFALAALVVGGMIFMMINALRGPGSRRPSAAPHRAHDADIIEGQFTVISNDDRTDAAARR